MSDLQVRLQAFELSDLFWEHDRLTLRSLTAAQRRAQVDARERLYRHAQRVADLIEDGTLPGDDARQSAAVAGIADLMGELWQHAREEHGPAPVMPGPRARRPLEAPAHLWSEPAAPPPAPSPKPDPAPSWDGPMVCRRCGLPLERGDLAATLGRPASQGWRHLDGRKTHFPEPVPQRCPVEGA